MSGKTAWSLQNLPKRMKSSSTEALSHQPTLKNLRCRLVQLLYSGMYDGAGLLPATLPTTKPEYQKVFEKVALADNIIVAPGACLVAWPCWDEVGEDGDLQIVRAAPRIYGQARYDFVSFQRVRSSSRSYAQLQLLVKAKCRYYDAESVDEPKWDAFAYLRCFQDADENVGDKFTTAGCVRIKPDYLQNKEWYEMVPLNSLLAHKFVAEVPNEQIVFHVSCFLPN